MTDINIEFCRQVLRRKHEELRKLFPGVRVAGDVGVHKSSTSTSTRTQWLFELVIDNVYWSVDVTADNAYDARVKGWDSFMNRCAEKLCRLAQVLAKEPLQTDRVPRELGGLATTLEG